LSYEELDKIADDLINCDKNGANEILANAEVFLLKQIELSDFCESIEKILNTIDNENIKSEVTNVLLDLKQLSGSLPEEQNLIEQNLKNICDTCQSFLKKLEEPEDPYAWPFDD